MMGRYLPSTIYRYQDLAFTQKVRTHRHTITTPHLHRVPRPTSQTYQGRPHDCKYHTNTETQKYKYHNTAGQHKWNQKQTRGAQTAYSHMQILSPFRKPSSPHIKNYPPCVQIGCTRQGVGSSHSLDTRLHSPQQTYLRP